MPTETMSLALASELRGTVVRLTRRLRRERPDVADLTPGHLAALGTLEKAGAMTPRELADAERVQPPSMTRITGRLAELGLLQRADHPTDGRQVVLAPTPAGRALVQRNRRLRDEWLARQVLALTPAERAVLRQATELLDRLARA